ncbi:MAG: N-acetylneuraminate synthase family protein [Ruminococcus sp.]|jgi:sialic acid synthase SpsE|nr:N-acetylneuraminate synthase family protein [Ruminococcus sp.]
MKNFNIGSIEVGGTPLVIPEIGINHGGSLEVALKMIDAAAAAGARLIKHQTHIVEDEMSLAAREIIPGNSDKSIYEIMARCALSEDEEREMMQYTNGLGLEFISTPFSRAAAIRLEKFGVKAYKIGSGEMNNLPLIKHIAAYGKPMIVSTGMNSIEAIEETVNILEQKNVPYALLHTTNLYPTKPSQVRFGAMMKMAEHFPGIPFGLSDHTLNNNACIGAAALGASIVERHFTDDKTRPGEDIICSMDGRELSELINATREVYQMRGGEKTALEEEKVTIDFAFATVVATDDIKKNEKFSEENIWVKRPGTGEIFAKDFEKIIGKTAAFDIKKDTHLKKGMICTD